MSSYTKSELAKLHRLQAKLDKAVTHSKEAVAVGWQIRGIDRIAYLRRRATITPAQDRAMKELGKRLGLE